VGKYGRAEAPRKGPQTAHAAGNLPKIWTTGGASPHKGLVMAEIQHSSGPRLPDASVDSAENPAMRIRLGIALTIVAALSYGSLPSLVRLAYAGGANEAGVMLFRAVAATLAAASMALATGKAVLPPATVRPVGVVVGAIWLISSYAYLGAIKRIPIGLAVTIFYLFPLVVALIARIWEGERLAPRRALALAGGFAGVSLAVGVSIGQVNPAGTLLALVAALGVASNITLSARIMRRSNPFAAIVLMAGSSAIVLAVAAPTFGGSLPHTALGWFGLLAASGLICVAMCCFYTSINMIGSVRAAMVCNIEPLAATVMAYLVLGEALGPLQLVGVAVVIAAIVLMQAGDLRRAR